MRLPNNLDRRSRWFRNFANLALVIGLSLWTFVRPEVKTGHAALDAVVGFLLGFSIAANLHLFYKSRRAGTGC